MVGTAAQIWRNWEVDGVPSSGDHDPRLAEIRTWGSWVEGMLSAFTSSGGLVFTSRAALYADLAHAAPAMAWVLGDPTTALNGVYAKLGASGTGSWSRVGELPYSFIIASDAGTGTANAIQATSLIPVNTASLIVTNVYRNTTASPATISFNGGSPLTIKTASGNNPVAGGLTSGMMIAGFISGSTFRLITDQTSAAIQAAAEAAAARAEAALAAFVGAYTVRSAGAVGNGTTDDRAAIVTADTSGVKDVIFPAGSYLVASDLTINNHVTRQPGAVIVIPNGVTLTLAGGFDSSPSQAFSCLGTGKVVFSDNIPAVGKIEWWGARYSEIYTSAQATLNLAALQAASKCGLNYVKGSPGTLFIPNTWYFIDQYCWFDFSGKMWEQNKGGTRIVVMNGTDHVVVMGPLTLPPGGFTSYNRNQRLSNVSLSRAVAPIPLTSPNNGAQPSGLLVHWTLEAYVDNVRTEENIIGFNINNVVSSRFDRCYSNRSIAGTGANVSNDIYWGWLLSNNSSVYLEQCGAGGNSPSNVDNVGLQGVGLLNDTFVTRFEAANVATGIFLSCASSTYGDLDVSLIGCRADSNTKFGIRIYGNAGQITMTDCYAATSGAAAIANFSFESCHGTISATGLQSVGLAAFVAGASGVKGVNIDSCSGLKLSVQDKGSASPLKANACSTSEIELQLVSDTSQPASTIIPALWLTGCARVKATLSADGPNRYGYGIYADSASDHIFADVSRTNAATVNGKAVSNNGTTVTAATISPVAFGTASMATGIF